jgi:hypothetical protein
MLLYTALCVNNQLSNTMYNLTLTYIMCAAPKDYNVHELVYKFVNTVISRYCKQGVKRVALRNGTKSKTCQRLLKFK